MSEDLQKLFEEAGIKPDDEDGRYCGTCGEHKPYTDFYKDGTDSDGNIKYRRDCKECYRRTRAVDRSRKKAKQVKQTSKRRK